MEVSGQFHFLAALDPEKNIQKYIAYTLDMSLDGPEIKSVLSLEDRNPCPCRISNSHSPVFHPVFQSHPLWGTYAGSVLDSVWFTELCVILPCVAVGLRLLYRVFEANNCSMQLALWCMIAVSDIRSISLIKAINSQDPSPGRAERRGLRPSRETKQRYIVMVCEGYQKGCADAIQTITFPNLLFKYYSSLICCFFFVEINILHGIRTLFVHSFTVPEIYYISLNDWDLEIDSPSY